MKKFLIFVCIINFKLSFGQIYFNRLIPFEFGNPNSVEIIQFNNSYLIPTIYFYEQYDQSTIIQIDEEFQTDYFHFQYFDFATKSLNIFDSEIVSYAKDRTQSLNLQIAKFNNNFDIEFSITIPTLGERNFPGPSQSLGKCLYNGLIYTEQDIKMIGINKSSVSGEILWTKYYENNIGYSYLWSLLPTIDSNLLASYTLRYDHEFRSNAYLMKIDTSGDVIWRTQPMELIDGGAAPIRMAELSNKQIVLTFRKDMWDVYEFWCCLHPKPPTFIWLDTEGQILNENIYRIQQYDELDFSDIEAGKGDYFFGYGQYTVDTGVGVDNYFGFITKFSNEGDTIWTRRYRHPEYNNERIFHVVKDIIELDNGDIIAMGAITPAGEKTEIWFFKVDSEGCFILENCEDIQISTAIDEYAEVESLRLYPNPTTQLFSLESDINFERIELYDITGKYLARFFDLKNMDISALQSGIYVVRLFISQTDFITQKLVKI